MSVSSDMHLPERIIMAYNNGTANGAGTSKGKSAEQMNAERRDKKRKQKERATSKRASSTTSNIIAESKLDKLNFYKEQSEMALRSGYITDLDEGSTARVFADAIIKRYPTARPGAGLNKFGAAAKLAYRDLSSDHQRRKGALNLGEKRARQALNKALSKLKGDYTVTAA